MKKLYLILMLQIITLVSFAQQFTLNHNGTTRTYIVHLPTGYTAGNSYPVVLNFHGWTNSASQQQSMSGMNTVANANKFIVVYPNGLNSSWNAGINNGGVDDIGFINTLLDVLIARYSVNTQRIYSTGFSMGGYFSYVLGCQLSNRIAAIAPVAGLMANSTTRNCAPARPVPVAHFHGTSDGIVPYSGVSSTLSYWRNSNSCTASPVTTSLPNNVELTVYGRCVAGAEVRLYKLNGAGHTWPRTTINASQEIWNFFKRFTLNSQNEAPVVTLTSPGANASFSAPASINIAANAYDADGTVTKVEFFSGSTKIGEDLTSPYTFTWANVPQGSYTLTAKATDNLGASTTSSSVAITVMNSSVCATLPAYTSNGGYEAGSMVTNNNNYYECKSASRCNSASWAYAPGSGFFWGYAWNYLGTCNAMRTAMYGAGNERKALIEETNVSFTDFLVYPNPADEKITISLFSPEDTEATISITDIFSKNAYNDTVNINEGENNVQVMVHNLPSGMYIVQLSMLNKTFMKKLQVK